MLLSATCIAYQVFVITKKKKKKITNTISGISKGASTARFALIFSDFYLLFALRSDDKTALAI